MHGLGFATVVCNLQIRSQVKINGITLEILFHVIEDSFLPHKIVIGSEILNSDLMMNIEATKCVLARSTRPQELLNSTLRKEKKISLNNVDIELSTERLVKRHNKLPETDFLVSPCLDNKINPCYEVINDGNSLECLTKLDNHQSEQSYFTIRADSDNNLFQFIKTEVPSEYKENLLLILKKYGGIFINGIPKRRVITGKMKINLIDQGKIVHRRPYKLSPIIRDISRRRIKELEDAKVIRPSTSPFASPALFVPKPDGDIRMAIDYRMLNENTVPQRFPLPLISDQIARLSGSTFFTSIDMASGFHQIPVEEESIEKTAFVTPDGQWEFLAMPFGLRNGPSVYQRAVMKALGDLAHLYVVCYMDDLLILATSPDEALQRLDHVIQVLPNTGFSINLKKCSFVVRSIKYLGYQVKNGEIRPNSTKVDALIQSPSPTTVRQLQSFLGLASYFRQFIQNFSMIASPLFRLLGNADKNGKLIEWSKEHETIRQQLISTLTCSPVLVIFNPDYPIELHTDASSIGFGAILINIIDKKPRVVAYFSKRTSPAESRYHSYELETLCVVYAIKHFNNFLQCHPFTVVTDCSSLRATQTKKELIPRVQRWWAFLQSYEFKIEYRQASRMRHVDFLSRNPIEGKINEEGLMIEKDIPENKLEVVSDSPTTTNLVNCNHLQTTSKRKNKAENQGEFRPQGSSSNEVRFLDGFASEKSINLTTLSIDWILSAQESDPFIRDIVNKLNSNEMDEDIHNTYEIRSGILYRKIQRNNRTRCLPIVPHSLKWSVVNNVHDSLFHLGYDKTIETLYQHYWFEHMAKFVKKFVDNCLVCKTSKSDSGPRQVQLHPIPKSTVPWHTIHIDATGKLSGKRDSKEYLFVTIDAFTKYCLLQHTRNLRSVDAIKALQSAINLFGPPARIICDQGGCYTSKEFQDFCTSHQIELHFIATGASRANGQVERVMSTLRNMLTVAETDENKTWQSAVGEIQLVLNTTPHRITKVSSMELMFGRVSKPLNLISITEAIVERPTINLVEERQQAAQAMEKQGKIDKEKFDQGKAKIVPFQLGELVLLKNDDRNQVKLNCKYRGPYRVEKILSNDRYQIRTLDRKRVHKFSHDRLRKAPSPLTDESVSYECEDS